MQQIIASRTHKTGADNALSHFLRLKWDTKFSLAHRMGEGGTK